MRRRLVLLLVAAPLFAAAAAADPPVTGKDARPPAAEAARRWALADFQVEFRDYLDDADLTDPARMLAAVLADEKLGPGVGWYGPAARRHDWGWLAARLDADRDGTVSAAELAAAPPYAARLDRDKDGEVTADDLDWSERSAWVRQDAQALALFRAIDRDGNGRATEAEMQAHFRRLAGDKGHVLPEDLRRALGAEKGKGKGKAVSREVWVECLKAGDLGSPFDGPRVGRPAPDFTLPTQDGLDKVTLSDFRGKKPVVLIFGSFT